MLLTPVTPRTLSPLECDILYGRPQMITISSMECLVLVIITVMEFVHANINMVRYKYILLMMVAVKIHFSVEPASEAHLSKSHYEYIDIQKCKYL